MSKSKYTWLWIAWIVAFLIIEGLAIFNKQAGDTLSEKVWEVGKIKVGRATWKTWAFRAGLGGLFVWLVPHFFGWELFGWAP